MKAGRSGIFIISTMHPDALLVDAYFGETHIEHIDNIPRLAVEAQNLQTPSVTLGDVELTMSHCDSERAVKLSRTRADSRLY